MKPALAAIGFILIIAFLITPTDTIRFLLKRPPKPEPCITKVICPHERTIHFDSLSGSYYSNPGRIVIGTDSGLLVCNIVKLKRK